MTIPETPQATDPAATLLGMRHYVDLFTCPEEYTTAEQFVLGELARLRSQVSGVSSPIPPTGTGGIADVMALHDATRQAQRVPSPQDVEDAKALRKFVRMQQVTPPLAWARQMLLLAGAADLFERVASRLEGEKPNA